MVCLFFLKRAVINPDWHSLIIQEADTPVPPLAHYLTSHHIISHHQSDDIIHYLQTHRPQLILLPEHEQLFEALIQDNTPSDYQPLLCFYETPQGQLSRFNWFLPLTEDDTHILSAAREFHASQIYRTPFVELPKYDSEQLARWRQNDAPLEGYFMATLRKGELDAANSQEIEALLGQGTLAIMAPHPDDAEIGSAGLIKAFQQTPAPIHVFNATSGARAQVFKADLNAQSYPDDIQAQLALETHEYVSSPDLVRRIRAHESQQALQFLSQAYQHPIHTVQLDLPLYYHQYESSDEDRAIIAQQLKDTFEHAEFPVISLPFLDDAHPAHANTAKAFLKAFQDFSINHPEKTAHVIFYKTPWTGDYNLYQYHPDGSWSNGIIGAERVQQKGAQGTQLLKALNTQHAFRYKVKSSSLSSDNTAS